MNSDLDIRTSDIVSDFANASQDFDTSIFYDSIGSML